MQYWYYNLETIVCILKTILYTLKPFYVYYTKRQLNMLMLLGNNTFSINIIYMYIIYDNLKS